MTNLQKQVPTKIIGIYLVIFFLWWSFYELSGFQLFATPFPQALSGSLIKFATWTVPAFLLMKKYHDSLYVPFDKIFTNKFRVAPYILITFLMISYIILGEWVEHGSLQFSNSFNATDLIGVFLFVGITEEMVFRGWLLNALLLKTTTIPAVLISSVLFLCIHFPIWVKTGSFIQNFASGGFINVLILSIIFSVIFLKSKNILVPIVIHMLWDLALLIF
ncbi:lysostaphin resistance A-like protein [Enterococcus sp. AZ103]|uniref:CPBP family intramembrane glutamic endopeptidase n=1 Tax=Enterococcus sp. AZ103 TaxID=2774628 RepID=UPI003F215ADC